MTITSEKPSVFSCLDPILRIIGNGQSPAPTELFQGMYLSTHWNFETYLSEEWEPWWSSDTNDLPDAYGVCDSPEQFSKKYRDALSEDASHEYIVSFVHIKKSTQDPEGGWRWHKWGEYVGDRNPTCEYLYDEPEIDDVYTFHVYRRAV